MMQIYDIKENTSLWEDLSYVSFLPHIKDPMDCNFDIKYYRYFEL